MSDRTASDLTAIGAWRYRPEIDGLRALAILLVVGRHIGVSGMSGGFAGVDIFFVISGYLITGLLVHERADGGRIAIADFYARRVRRLLPALATVIVATLLLSWALLLPDEQTALAKSALASLAFVANLYFEKVHSDYFAEASQLMPLQHLWTLALEEQFYLFWPVAIAALSWLGTRSKFGAKRTIVAALAVGGLASLSLGIAMSSRFPIPAFFLLPTRAWELGAGCLLALSPAIPARWSSVLAPIGLIAIVSTAMLFDDATPFPSFYALLPVLGTMALIAGGAAGAIGRVLGSRPAVGLGKLSYAWYLWHWPLLAFARILCGIQRDLARDAAMAAVALALAAVTWRWIEMPVRERHVAAVRTTRGALAWGAAILLACAVASGALLAWSHRPLPPNSILAQYRAARGHEAQDFPFCDGNRLDRHCVFGAVHGSPAILLWGDSHAAHLTEGLDRAARVLGLKIVARTMGSCSPGGFPGAAPQQDGGLWARCGAFNDAMLASIARLRRDDDIEGVVASGMWAADRTGWDSQLAAQVRALQRAGLRVVLVRSSPVLPPDFMTCLQRRGADACALPRTAVERQAAEADAVLARIAAANPDVRLWSPLDALCPKGRCQEVMGGRLLFRQRDHLTIDGSAVLAQTMVPMLRWLAQMPRKN